LFSRARGVPLAPREKEMKKEREAF